MFVPVNRSFVSSSSALATSCVLLLLLLLLIPLFFSFHYLKSLVPPPLSHILHSSFYSFSTPFYWSPSADKQMKGQDEVETLVMWSEIRWKINCVRWKLMKQEVKTVPWRVIIFTQWVTIWSITLLLCRCIMRRSVRITMSIVNINFSIKICCLNKVCVFAPLLSGMRSPSPSCATSCGSSTRKRMSRRRRWFAATRPTARDCRRRWGRSEGPLRGLTPSEQDYCPLEARRRDFFFFPAEKKTSVNLWTQSEERGPSAWKKGWNRQKEGGYKRRDSKRRMNGQNPDAGVWFIPD